MPRDDEPRSPMGSKSADGRTGALDELRQIFGDLNRVTDINDLKPIYYRLESLSQKHSSDADVQSVLAEVRQRLIAKGQSLMEGGAAPPNPVVPPPPHVPTKTAQPQKASPPAPPPPGVPSPVPPSAAPPPPPPGPTRTAPSAPAAAPPPASYDWKKTVIMGAAIGMIVFLVGVALLRSRKTPPPPPPPTAISVQVQTTPAGASIRVNNEPKCTSDCTLSLPPGKHQIQAFLDGYEPSVRTVDLTAGTAAAPVDFQLQPSAQTVRVNADVDQGKAKLDEDPPVDLVDGAATFDKVAPGKHSVKITGRGADVTIAFEIVPGKAPVIDAAPVSRTHVAVVISNFQTSARLHSNKSDLKVAVDGQPAGQPGAGGLDLTNLQSGFREITFGEGEEAQKKLISIGPAPMLTTFIMRPAVTTGSLMVVTGEDAVTIFIGGRDRGKTDRGSRRIPNLPMGTYKVRVAKEGYQTDGEQEVVIKKGEETKAEFQLRPVARLSAIALRGCLPGATISIDGNQIGTVGADGNFSAGNIQPREHIVELRRDTLYRRLPKQFSAGATVEIRPPECVLEPVPGTLRINVAPSDARISYRKSEEAAGQTRPIPSAEFQTPPGSYVITATAPNHNTGTRTVTVTSGATQIVDIALTPIKGTTATTTTPQPRGPYGMESWENPAAWTSDGSWSDARGGDFRLYKIVPTFGAFDFKVRLGRGRQIKWVVNFIDARNYCMFLLDDNGKGARRVFVDGRRGQDVDFNHGLRTKEFTVRIDVTPSGIRHHLLVGNSWKLMDAWNFPVPPGGKFGVYLPGRDEIGFENFKFTPR